MSNDPDCLGLCGFDDDTCSGCGRTLDQITHARTAAAPPPPPQVGTANRREQ
jgi:hypothetical protein